MGWLPRIDETFASRRERLGGKSKREQCDYGCECETVWSEWLCLQDHDVDVASGSAAAQCGKALPYRQASLKGLEAAPPINEAEPQERNKQPRAGKAKHFRTVRRQSRLG